MENKQSGRGGSGRGQGAKPRFGKAQKLTSVRLPEHLVHYLKKVGRPKADTIREALELHQRLYGNLTNCEKDKFYAYWVDRSVSGKFYLWQGDGILLGTLVWGERHRETYQHMPPHPLQFEKGIGRKIPVEHVGKLPLNIVEQSDGFVGYETFDADEDARIRLVLAIEKVAGQETEDYLYGESQIDLMASDETEWDGSGGD